MVGSSTTKILWSHQWQPCISAACGHYMFHLVGTKFKKVKFASGRGTGVPPVGTEDRTWPGHGRDGHATKTRLERD